MAFIAGRSSITYYSDDSHYSHRIRIVLSAKEIILNIKELDVTKDCDFLASINPYGTLPVLQDRDLCLYSPGIILEYLEERFPFPPLYPGDPKQRADYRVKMYRMDKDWYSCADILMSPAGTYKNKECKEARRYLRNDLIEIQPIFINKPYFFSDSFTVMDCWLLPFLWRLPLLDIKLPPNKIKGMQSYMDSMFQHPAFVHSLSEREIEIRD